MINLKLFDFSNLMKILFLLMIQF